MHFKSLSFIVFSLFILAGCGKDGCKDPAATNYDPDAKNDDGSCVYPTAKLKIHSPSNNAMFSLGDTVHIHAVATHNEMLHGWNIHLVNTSSGDTVLFKHAHEHGTTLNIHHNWVNDVTQHSDMKLTIEVMLDHGGNEIYRTVNFHCHPM